MNEFLSQTDPGHEQGESEPDKFQIVYRMQVLGIDINSSDIEGMEGDELIGAIITYANNNDFDEYDLLREVLGEQLEEIREFDDEI